jgi:OmpA-OmpF porin, OOP family
MKTKAVIAVLGLAAAVAAAPAAAQMRGAPGAGPYVGLKVGQAQYKFSCATGPCDDKGRTFGLFGGYQFNRNLALELQYSDLGKSTFGSTNLRDSVWDLSGLYLWPIGQFSVYGRLGGYMSELRSTNPFTGVELKASNGGLTWGIGGQMDLRPIAIRAEFQRYEKVGGDAIIEKAAINVLTVGALWKF